MKNAIVTGANGFVGIAVCKELHRRGYKVHAIIRDSKSNINHLREMSNICIYYIPIERYGELPDSLKNIDKGLFYHFAWESCSGVGRGDFRLQTENIMGACEAALQAAKIGCKRFIFAGSIMEKEVIDSVSKNIHIGINTVYSAAKLAADYMSRAVSTDRGMEYVGALISNIYGPGEKRERLINNSIRKLIRGERCSFTSANQMYDFIYVTDAARAFVDIGEKGIAGKTYYIGNPEQKPLKEYLLEMRDIVAPGVELGIGDLGEPDISMNYENLDTVSLSKDTGFKVEVGFSEGIWKTMEWIKESRS